MVIGPKKMIFNMKMISQFSNINNFYRNKLKIMVMQTLQFNKRILLTKVNQCTI